MSNSRDNDAPTNRYIELAPPQVLSDRWLDLNFDLAPGQNVLCEIMIPESGGGYVYKDAKAVGSATQNRFLYWRSVDDIVELVELSTEVELENNQVRIKFANSPVINNLNVIEFSDSLTIMIATNTSVHRLNLPHPKTTNKSVLNELTTELIFNPANYYILSTQSSIGSQQPICATSWHDDGLLKCALCLPDSSIHIIQFSRVGHHISTSTIKQTGIMGRLWSKMPNLLARSQNECDNAAFACIPRVHDESNDVLLFTLCKDLKIRIFSTTSRECVCTHNVISQSSFTQSFASHTNPVIELPMMKVSGSSIIVYLTENGSEFVLFNHTYNNGQHQLKDNVTIQTPSWEKLIDFAITNTKVWALATIRETQSSLCFIDLRDAIEGGNINEGEFDDFVWDFVHLDDDMEIPKVKNYVAEIFWRNRFSTSTVQKALVVVAGPTVPKTNSMESLEEIAFTKIINENQEEVWSKFYNYCVQNHHSSNKPLGLLTNPTEDLMIIVKRSNPSFICPWLMSIDLASSEGPYRGIEFPPNTKAIIGPLNHISNEVMISELDHVFEQRLLENPGKIMDVLDELADSVVNSASFVTSKINLPHKNITTEIFGTVISQLSISQEADIFGEKILKEATTGMRSELNPLGSNCGITLTFELFKHLVRGRMILARDLLIYIKILNRLSDSEKSSMKHLSAVCQELYTSCKIRELIDCLRSYAILVWITEAPIKGDIVDTRTEFVDSISKYFRFFKAASSASKKFQDNPIELVIRKNLLMNFLFNGGVNYLSFMKDRKESPQTLSNSLYTTNIALNICRLLWPVSEHLCMNEYLFSHHLDEHLARYNELTAEWISNGEPDRNFIKASNCVLQNRDLNAVDIFNRLWSNINANNMIGRFVGMDEEPSLSKPDSFDSTNAALVYRYYDRLINLFQTLNNLHSLVMLINHCMSLLDDSCNEEQQYWVDCLRAKLFQYYLELDEPEDAYHTMVLTNDPSLRFNCLRKFIVSHCDKEQWSSLISHPYIDIKEDFIDILVQKADSLDLSRLNMTDFYRTSYYDLLFAFHVSYEEYRKAAHVMYNYAQRLAQEVPGILSIKKQADCLLVALNSLRCVPVNEAFLKIASPKSEGRASVVKRSYDCESKTDTADESSGIQIIGCEDIELKYELTHARLKLLEKDQTANAIALSPLNPDETIAQLVASSMYPLAMDLATSFCKPMEIILDGLASKYVFISRLSAIDIASHQDLETDLSNIFASSYSTIDTYNYVANSSCSFVDKLWRLINYYLTTFDGIGHRYRSEEISKTFSGTSVLMRTVAIKLLSAGYDIPASLKRMYMSKNTAELLKLLIKYDKLSDAADLSIEMINRVLEPSNLFTLASPLSASDPPPVTIPTHLILLLIAYLNEDATNTTYLKAAGALNDKLQRFRSFIRS